MRRLAATIALALAAALAVPGAIAPAQAAGDVSISGVDGGARASSTGATTLRLSGSGFQSVAKGFGGIYVLFGWVDGGAWAPSKGGATGQTLRYVPDAETGANSGYQRFVAFPGSSTAGEANGGLIDADGTWSADLVVPGPVFAAQDRSGAAVEVNCLEVTCGVITIGAHGVANASNETFTPVEFVGESGSGDGGGAGDAPAGAKGDAGDGGTPAADDGTPAGGGTDTADGAADGAAPAPSPSSSVAAGPATLGIDQATAVAGRVLSFAGQGFQPGEQVTVVLDDGVLAVGPLTAGTHGEIAGLLELPDDLRLGTHVLKVTAASSGKQPEIEITVTRDPAEASTADALIASASGTGTGVAGVAGTGYSAAELAAAAALLVLLLVVVSSAITAVRRRRAGRAGAASAAPTPSGRHAEPGEGTA